MNRIDKRTAAIAYRCKCNFFSCNINENACPSCGMLKHPDNEAPIDVYIPAYYEDMGTGW